MDPNNADQERAKAEREAQAEAASQAYQEKTQASEKKYGDRVWSQLNSENGKKLLALGTLELFPVFGGWSLADVYILGEGLVDIYKGMQNEDYTRVAKGALKATGAAIPNPFSEGSVALDVLLPNKEQSEQTVNNNQPK